MTENQVLQLRKLIEDTKHREHECREFLQYAKETLIRDTVREFVYVEKERRGSSGDSDYIISCKVCDETGVESVKAYVWELKAPQCYIFERDTENRIRPTLDLIKAENQLLHYYHEQRGSEEFRHTFGVTHSDNVLFGGIIIGCRKTKVKGEYEDTKKNKLFEKALMIRKTYLYDQRQLRILDWDHILDFLSPSVPLYPQHVDIGEVKSQTINPLLITVTTSG